MIGIEQEIPSQIRDSAEKSVDQARTAFLSFIDAAQKVTGTTQALPSGATEAMQKAKSFAEDNVKAALDLAQKLVHAKDLQEIVALQTAFATSQFAAIQTQANDLAAASQSAVVPEIKH
jgi:phasin